MKAVDTKTWKKRKIMLLKNGKPLSSSLEKMGGGMDKR